VDNWICHKINITVIIVLITILSLLNCMSGVGVVLKRIETPKQLSRVVLCCSSSVEFGIQRLLPSIKGVYMEKIVSSISVISIVSMLCSPVNAQYNIENATSDKAVGTYNPVQNVALYAAKRKEVRKPRSLVHIDSTAISGRYFNNEPMAEEIEFWVNGSSESLSLSIGMTRAEVETTLRSVNLTVAKVANTWKIDNAITVEYDKNGKVSRLTVK